MSDAFAMARARKALAEAGLDMHLPLTRASSVTNEVWISDEYVVRVNRQLNQRLRREARLGPSLPPEVCYPEIVAYGGQMGADWLVVRRVRGNPLSRCWPTMAPHERRAAVRQVATMLRALHATPCPPGLPDIDTPQLLGARQFGAHAVDPLLAALDKAEQLPEVDRSLIAETRRLIHETGDCLEPFGVRTLVHGDLHFENVLWDGLAVTTVLDFEWCRPAPPDLELDIFLRFCAYPFLHVADDYEHLTRAEDYEPVAHWMAEDYPGLFAADDGFERTRLFAIAYDVRELLLFPPPRPPRELSTYHPHNRLERTVRGGSHLHKLAESRAAAPSEEPYSVGGAGVSGSASDLASSPRVPR
jgi:aminoglycoside phosphotransferase (APT) family kinase protein